MTTLEPYGPTVVVAGITGLLLLIQLLIADLLAIRAKHPPGHPIPADYRQLLFRASRAHANTNESVAVFILFALFGVVGGASAAWLNGMALVYLAGRAGHMLCYYADLGTPRSAAFGVSVIGLLGMFVAGVIAWV